VNLWRIARIYVLRARLALIATLRDAARRLGIRLPRDLGWELVDLAARGVRVVFEFYEGEAGIDLLRNDAGSAVKRCADGCRVHTIANADHIFSQSTPRRRLEEILSEELFAPLHAPRDLESRTVSELA
jgi:hypothetical protein